MIKSSIKKTIKHDLCVSCGICIAVCPTDAIRMEYAKGQFLPKVGDKCKTCGTCLQICPGINIWPQEFVEGDMLALQEQNCLECYIAFSNNLEIRKNSTSGGVLLDLTANLISNGEYDYAFVLNSYKFDGKEAMLEKTNDVNELLSSAKSKYIPVSFFNVCTELKKHQGRRYIIIGTGCGIYGVKRFMKQSGISDENVIFLGLFCDKTMNFNMPRFLENSYRKAGERVKDFYFRTKEKSGWPGDVKIIFDSGRQVFVDKELRMRLKRYFQLKRCLFCLDKLNYFSDISFGDCYIKGKEDYLGSSNIAIMTEKGKDVFRKFSRLFSLEKISIGDIINSQKIAEKKENLRYISILGPIFQGADIASQCPADRKDLKRLSQSLRWIKLGQNYNAAAIRCHLFFEALLRKAASFKKIFITTIEDYSCLLLFIVYTLLFQLWKKDDCQGAKNNGDNIIIVGAHTFNKGSQAMIFAVADRMRRHFPEKNIYLFSSLDYSRPPGEKDIYNFEILPWSLQINAGILGVMPQRFLQKKQFEPGVVNKIKEVITKADFFIDISGYALSSQLGYFACLSYLCNIATAKKYSIRYFIFPQSIGPFNFKLCGKIFLYPLIKFYLKYPAKIFVREKDSEAMIRRFTNADVSHYPDIVLQNRIYNLNNIYKKKPNLQYIDVKPGSVAIIPNQRLLEKNMHNDILGIYKSIMDYLCEGGRDLYLVRHSNADLSLCRRIKNIFDYNDSVKLLSYDLNAIEFEYLVKQFEFIVASRYHSIIHAYKNGVPAVVIGWAGKYNELLSGAHQLEYFFDCRCVISTSKIKQSIARMEKEYKNEALKIRRFLGGLDTAKNLLDSFPEYCRP